MRTYPRFLWTTLLASAGQARFALGNGLPCCEMRQLCQAFQLTVSPKEVIQVSPCWDTSSLPSSTSAT